MFLLALVSGGILAALTLPHFDLRHPARDRPLTAQERGIFAAAADRTRVPLTRNATR